MGYVGRLAVLGQAGRNCFENNPKKKAVFFIQSLVLGLFPPGGDIFHLCVSPANAIISPSLGF
jgi:hypothetical protein